MLLAYLIEPGRSEYLLDDLAAEYAVEAKPEPDAEEETDRLVRHAAVTLRLRDPLLERVRERGSERLYRDVEMPLVGVLRAMEDAGIKIDTYRMGEITARLADRVEELESRAYELAGEEFMLGSTQQLARILFEKLELTPGRKGKTGYSTDTKVLRSIRDEHPIVAVVEEWRELTKLLNTYLVPAAGAARRGRPPAHDTSTRPSRRPAASRPRTRTSRRSRSAPSSGKEIRSAFVAEPGHRLISADYSQIELRILAHVSGEPKLREAFERGEDIHTGDRGGGARRRSREAHVGRAQHREDDQLRDRLRHLRVRALREPRDPARAGAGVHRRVPRALPDGAGLHPAHDRAVPSATAT